LCCEHDIGHEGPHTYDVQAQIDAAVAREREEVQAHAPLYLEWVKEGALSADDALERLVIWLRARSAKGE
jgi:hypothetical protein